MTLFELGAIVITRTAHCALDPASVLSSIQRHARGDWGDLDEHDRGENDLSLKEGFRLFSAYEDMHQVKFWIITEADRSSTTILLPEDY